MKPEFKIQWALIRYNPPPTDTGVAIVIPEGGAETTMAAILTLRGWGKDALIENCHMMLDKTLDPGTLVIEPLPQREV
jgi:hypothetical protein